MTEQSDTTVPDPGAPTSDREFQVWEHGRRQGHNEAKRAHQTTTIRPWIGWQYEAMDRISDAKHAVHQARADIAIQCLQAAIEILQKGNTNV